MNEGWINILSFSVFRSSLQVEVAHFGAQSEIQIEPGTRHSEHRTAILERTSKWRMLHQRKRTRFTTHRMYGGHEGELLEEIQDDELSPFPSSPEVPPTGVL